MSFNGVFERDTEVEVILRGCVSRSLHFLHWSSSRLIKQYLNSATYHQHLFSM